MKWFLLILILAVIVVGCDSQARTMIIEGGVSSGDGENDTNETIRVEAIVNTSCTAGNFIYTFLDNGTGVCDAPAGSGDVTAVLTDTTDYLTGGASSGDISINFNENILNGTIDARDTNCTADGSCSLIVYEGDTNRVLLHYDNVTSIPNCTDTDEYLTMVAGTLSCSSDDDTADTTCDGGSCTIANDGTLDGYEASELLGGSGVFNITYINFSANTYTGEVINGTLTGYNAAQSICMGDHDGAWVCTTSDISNYARNYNISAVTGWGWIITGPPKYAPADHPVNDCSGFTSSATGATDSLGTFWNFDVGYGTAGNCATDINIVCCK